MYNYIESKCACLPFPFPDRIVLYTGRLSPYRVTEVQDCILHPLPFTGTIYKDEKLANLEAQRKLTWFNFLGLAAIATISEFALAIFSFIGRQIACPFIPAIKTTLFLTVAIYSTRVTNTSPRLGAIVVSNQIAVTKITLEICYTWTFPFRYWP